MNTIAFNIPGVGVRRILLTSDVLPQIVEPVIIDGYTQPGSSVNTASSAFNGVLRVRLDGILLGYGRALDITAGNSTVRGLNIMNFAGAAVACSGAAAAPPSAHHQPYHQPRAHHHMEMRASQLRS